MKSNRRIIQYILYIVLGAVLVGLSLFELFDAFWSGMGGGLIAVGVIRIIHIFRFTKDESYREKMEIDAKDERNQFIRNKAWAWAAYFFVLIAAVSVIVFKLLGQDLLYKAAAFAICILLILYCICHLTLNKKY